MPTKCKSAEKRNIFRQRFRAANGREQSVTIHRLQGAQSGPVLTLIAGQHGSEHRGPIVLERFLSDPPSGFLTLADIEPDSFEGGNLAIQGNWNGHHRRRHHDDVR